MATHIRVSTLIPASRAQVWNVVRDIGSHVRWMHDAEAIRFTSSKREGVGTAFECDSRLGPFRLTDRMEVVEWREGRAMAIRHVGKVTGVGRFTLRLRPRGTLFVWQETLRFPWWMGGPLGSRMAAPLFRRIWKRNLSNLRREVETGRSFSPRFSHSRSARPR
ncbi:MAG: SRPBCC family protein [Actinobacteria bacterium]|nr:SRPBCC family protein [Actinomycetota bacterium]